MKTGKVVFQTANKLDICPSRWIYGNDVIPLDVEIYSVSREKMIRESNKLLREIWKYKIF